MKSGSDRDEEIGQLGPIAASTALVELPESDRVDTMALFTVLGINWWRQVRRQFMQIRKTGRNLTE